MSGLATHLHTYWEVWSSYLWTVISGSSNIWLTTRSNIQLHLHAVISMSGSATHLHTYWEVWSSYLWTVVSGSSSIWLTTRSNVQLHHYSCSHLAVWISHSSVQLLGSVKQSSINCVICQWHVTSLQQIKWSFTTSGKPGIMTAPVPNAADVTRLLCESRKILHVRKLYTGHCSRGSVLNCEA